jgi:branched-chain amino acid transport system permease protein
MFNLHSDHRHHQRYGQSWGVLLGALMITLFDSVLLAQIAPPLIRNLGNQLDSDFLRTFDLTLYRWVMFGAGLLVIMLIRPEGLFPSKVRRMELHEADHDDREEVATHKRFDSEDAPDDAQSSAEGGA